MNMELANFNTEYKENPLLRLNMYVYNDPK